MSLKRDAISDAAEVIHRDLAYADRSPLTALDLYMPKGVEGPPVVVQIHGGAFVAGDKSGHGGSGPTGARALLQAGLAVAAINYRLAPGTVWPGQLDDMLDAFAFIRRKAGTYGYDGGRIGIFGQSAGAYFAAMTAIALALDPMARVKAAVLWHPPIDFTTMDKDMAATGTPPKGECVAGADSPESRFIGAPVGENDALAWLASPIAYLEALPQSVPLPPFLMMHGAQDPLIGHGQSLRLLNALAARRPPPRLEYVLLPEGDHGGGDFRSPRTRDRVLDFLKSELGES